MKKRFAALVLGLALLGNLGCPAWAVEEHEKENAAARGGGSPGRGLDDALPGCTGVGGALCGLCL